MNKIFKVIWNNAKHCYVVASELAKSYSKGGGSRSIRRAAIALGVAAAVYAAAGNVLAANDGGHQDDVDYVGDSPYIVTIDNSEGISYVFGRKESNNISEKATVNIIDGDSFEVYGGYSKTGDAASNTINISGGSMTNVIGGYSHKSKSASNTINISNGNVDCAYGGLVNEGTGDAANNSVNIKGGTVGNVHGGRNNNSGAAASNFVNISGGSVEDSVYGGWSLSGDVASNSINISDGEIGGDVSSGFTINGDAASNSVRIIGGEISGNIYGGSTIKGNAASNSVNIIDGIIVGLKDGEFYGNVYGGYVQKGTGAAASNSVIISGDSTQINGNIYGGYSYSGKVASNSVNIIGGTICRYCDEGFYGGNVYGGYSKNGEASSNNVSISGGTVEYCVNGGYSESGNAALNSVNVSGGSINAVNGGFSETGNATSNSVNISGGNITYDVNGGYSESGNADCNSVSISEDSTSIGNNVFGGYSKTGNAASNSVNISGDSTQINGNIYGGFTINGAAASNSVNIIDGTIVGLKDGEFYGNVYGGYVQKGTGAAASNSVIISGDSTQINGNIYGGYSYSGKVASNSVNIIGGTICRYGYDEGYYGGNVYGGYSESGNADCNSVSISEDSTSIGNNVFGGYSELGNAASNSLNISGGTVENSVFGGYSKTGEATSNSVIISGGEVGGSVWGGIVEDGTGDADHNSVTITNVTIYGSVFGGNVWKGKGDAAADSNSVTINGGTVYGDVFGGEVAEGSGDASRNLVTINEGIVDSVIGGEVWDGSGNATSNSVIISGGTVGSAYGGNVVEGSGDAINNSVNISGGTVNDSVYGGFTDGSGDASNNSVTINGGTVNNVDTDWFESPAGSGNWVMNPPKLTGGFSTSGTVIGNQVSITNAALGGNYPSVYGGYSRTGNVSKNVITVESENSNLYVYGGCSETGAVGGDTAADGNIVTVKSGEVNYVVGGFSVSQDVKNNKALIEGGTVGNFVAGGLSDGGTVSSNVVNISGSITTISGTGDHSGVYGGYVEQGSGIATSNSVTISNGTINSSVYGGRSTSGNSFTNTVNISGGTVSSVFGGFSYSGDVTRNNTNINGGTIVSKSNIYAGYVYESNNSTISDNVVNLGGTVTGLNNSEICGYFFESGSGTHSGNELHIGRTIDYDDEGKIKRDTNGNAIYKADETTIWQGKTSEGTVNNSVKKVANFEILALHSVAWNNDLPAIKAAAIENIGTVDITDLKFYENSSEKTTFNLGDKMNLLTWENEKEALINLKYKLNGTGDEQTAVFSDNPKGITVKTKSVSETNNGISFEGTNTGNINKIDKALEFSFASITLNSVDLSGWDGKNTSEVPSGWISNDNGVNVYGVFADPGLSDGESKNILTSSTSMFKDENIDESIRFTEKGSFKEENDNGVTLSGIKAGGVKATDEGKALTYYAMEKTINKFDLADWDCEKASSVNSSWKLAENTTVETDGMSNLPDSDEEKQLFILKSDTEGYFANVAINGENVYGKKQNKFTDSDEAERVVLTGTQEKGVTFDSSKTNLVYKLGSKDITNFKLNTIAWEDGAEILSRDKYNYSKLTSLDTKDFNITYEKPETVEANQSMTLLKANETLADMAAIDNSFSYQYEPVSGVIMDAMIRNSLEAKSGKVTLKAVSNKADKLTFSDIEWLDKGALIDHKTMLNNISFDGADVDTTKIAFTNKQKLDADMQMTLVSDFGDSVGTITGTKYKVGTAFEGEGSAYLDGSDLVFKTKTGAGVSDETHTTVMAMEAGTAILAAGNEHIDKVSEGLGLPENTSSDGTSTVASIGGGASRYETGSHVDTNSWNCTLAVGKNLEKKDGTIKFGLFAEYGRGNYTLHMDGVDNAGSGNTHYTGGGLLLKWTNIHNVYTEASFRMGNMKDKASSLLHDGTGNAYGYDTSAKYRGGHFGIGKICRDDNDTKLEIYGKYFYNQREGINFAAGADQYSLEDVRSRMIRAGFRLSSTNKKWNRYGGIAYDYELDGESKGTVNGTQISSASVKGGTLRGEFGYCKEATKTNPWKTDISLYGFTGKRKGVGGSIAVEYHF